MNYKKLSKEPLYFKYEFADMFVRTEPGSEEIKYFVKIDGKPEVESDPGKNNQLIEALTDGEEISKKDYDNA